MSFNYDEHEEDADLAGSGGGAFPSGSREHEGDEHEEDADLAGSGGGAFPTGSREHEEDEALDALSDVSDNSDLFHVSAVTSAEPRSEEDADIRVCRAIASHLRGFPLLPPDGRDEEKAQSFRDVQSCVAFLMLHCGFKGCGYFLDAAPKYHWHHELKLGMHLHSEHRLKEMASVPASAWEPRIKATKKQEATRRCFR